MSAALQAQQGVRRLPPEVNRRGGALAGLPGAAMRAELAAQHIGRRCRARARAQAPAAPPRPHALLSRPPHAGFCMSGTCPSTSPRRRCAGGAQPSGAALCRRCRHRRSLLSSLPAHGCAPPLCFLNCSCTRCLASMARSGRSGWATARRRAARRTWCTRQAGECTATRLIDATALLSIAWHGPAHL